MGSARTMAQLRNAIIKQMMSTATDAELIALGERFEKLLLEYVDAWLAWAPLPVPDLLLCAKHLFVAAMHAASCLSQGRYSRPGKGLTRVP